MVTGRKLVLALVLCGLCLPAGARGDSDPPSDILYNDDVYYPYTPKVPEADARRLDALVARVHRLGFPLKVAMVATEQDLGGVPVYFGHPSNYAAFLETEIAFGRPVPLLVVMPSGYGVAGVDKSGLEGLPAPDQDAAALGRFAIQAVATLARARGLPVTVPKLAAKSGGPARSGGKPGGGGSWVVFAVPVMLLIAALGVVTLRDRRRDD